MLQNTGYLVLLVTILCIEIETKDIEKFHSFGKYLD